MSWGCEQTGLPLTFDAVDAMQQLAGHPLWLGHYGDTCDIKALTATGISALVDLAVNEAPPRLPREFVYCRIPLLDGAGNPRWKIEAAVTAVAQLLQANVPTLLYCAAGMSRTPCIAAAAVTFVCGLPLELALTLATSGRASDVSPSLWKDVCDVSGSLS